MFSHVMLGTDDVAASKRFYDAALAPLIEAGDERSMGAALAELLASRAQPLVERVLRRYRREDPLLSAEDLDDVAGGTMLRLVPKLESAAR